MRMNIIYVVLMIHLTASCSAISSIRNEVKSQRTSRTKCGVRINLLPSPCSCFVVISLVQSLTVASDISCPSFFFVVFIQICSPSMGQRNTLSNISWTCELSTIMVSTSTSLLASFARHYWQIIVTGRAPPSLENLI